MHCSISLISSIDVTLQDAWTQRKDLLWATRMHAMTGTEEVAVFASTGHGCIYRTFASLTVLNLADESVVNGATWQERNYTKITSRCPIVLVSYFSNFVYEKRHLCTKKRAKWCLFCTWAKMTFFALTFSRQFCFCSIFLILLGLLYAKVMGRTPHENFRGDGHSIELSEGNRMMGHTRGLPLLVMMHDQFE